MKLDDILAMWKNDCAIKESELDQASIMTPLLHSKYLELHSMFKMKLKNAEYKFNALFKNKWLHYSGKLSKDEMDQLGWDYNPTKGLKVLKGDLDMYLEADEDILKAKANIDYLKNCVETLDEILQNIKWRHQVIGNAIKFKQFVAGI